MSFCNVSCLGSWLLNIDLFIYFFELGSIDESPRRIEMINGAKESGVPGSTEKSEDSGSDDGEIGASDSDEEHDSRTNVESITSRRYSYMT